MFDYCRAPNLQEDWDWKPEEQPIALSTFLKLIRINPSVLVDSTLGCVPNEAKRILGRGDLCLDDLTLLPPASLEHPSCYVGLAAKNLADYELDNDVRFSIDNVLGEPCKVGAYVGSSAPHKTQGMGKRLAEHH